MMSVKHFLTSAGMLEDSICGWHPVYDIHGRGGLGYHQHSITGGTISGSGSRTLTLQRTTEQKELEKELEHFDDTLEKKEEELSILEAQMKANEISTKRIEREGLEMEKTLLEKFKKANKNNPEHKRLFENLYSKNETISYKTYERIKDKIFRKASAKYDAIREAEEALFQNEVKLKKQKQALEHKMNKEKLSQRRDELAKEIKDIETNRQYQKETRPQRKQARAQELEHYKELAPYKHKYNVPQQKTTRYIPPTAESETLKEWRLSHGYLQKSKHPKPREGEEGYIDEDLLTPEEIQEMADEEAELDRQIAEEKALHPHLEPYNKKDESFEPKVYITMNEVEKDKVISEDLEGLNPDYEDTIDKINKINDETDLYYEHFNIDIDPDYKNPANDENTIKLFDVCYSEESIQKLFDNMDGFFSYISEYGDEYLKKYQRGKGQEWLLSHFTEKMASGEYKKGDIELANQVLEQVLLSMGHKKQILNGDEILDNCDTLHSDNNIPGATTFSLDLVSKQFKFFLECKYFPSTNNSLPVQILNNRNMYNDYILKIKRSLIVLEERINEIQLLVDTELASNEEIEEIKDKKEQYDDILDNISSNGKFDYDKFYILFLANCPYEGFPIMMNKMPQMNNVASMNKIIEIAKRAKVCANPISDIIKACRSQGQVNLMVVDKYDRVIEFVKTNKGGVMRKDQTDKLNSLFFGNGEAYDLVIGIISHHNCTIYNYSKDLFLKDTHLLVRYRVAPNLLGGHPECVIIPAERLLVDGNVRLHKIYKRPKAIDFSVGDPYENLEATYTKFKNNDDGDGNEILSDDPNDELNHSNYLKLKSKDSRNQFIKKYRQQFKPTFEADTQDIKIKKINISSLSHNASLYKALKESNVGHIYELKKVELSEVSHKEGLREYINETLDKYRASKALFSTLKSYKEHYSGKITSKKEPNVKDWYDVPEGLNKTMIAEIKEIATEEFKKSNIPYTAIPVPTKYELKQAPRKLKIAVQPSIKKKSSTSAPISNASYVHKTKVITI